jgi:Protein of unknown function (DUF4012)
VLVGGIVVVGWLAFAGWTLLHAHADIEAGRNDVRAVQGLTPSELLDGTAETGLIAAHDHFNAAVQGLGHPIVTPIRLVPWVGRQLQSVTALATSAREATDLVTDGIARIEGAVGDGVPAGADRPAALAEMASATDELSAGLRHLDLGPDRALIGKLAEARTEFAREIDDLADRLDNATTVSRGLADLLAGPHRYLVLAANNAQMQNGQGMFLDYGVIETSGGEIHLSEFASVPDLPTPAARVALDPDIAATWPWLDPNDDWRHLGTTARFPATAATAQRLWAAIGRPAVDGVLAVDAVALRSLLILTGPVDVDGATIDAASVEAYLLHDQYVEFFGTGATTDAAQVAREDRLHSVARATLDAVGATAHLDLSALASIGQTLVERHMMAWSSIPEQQAAFEAAGMDGSVPADGVLVSVVNRGANKLDWFVDVDAALDIEGTDGTDGTDRVTLTVNLLNAVDPAAEPRYVAGPYEPGLAAGDYLGVVTATIPGEATDVTVEGGSVVVAGRDGDSLLYGAGIQVGPGTGTTVVFRFKLGPGDPPDLDLQPSGRAHDVEWLVEAP